MTITTEQLPAILGGAPIATAMGWTGVDIALLVTLLPLLCMSAFFSCSETNKYRFSYDKMSNIKFRNIINS